MKSILFNLKDSPTYLWLLFLFLKGGTNNLI